MNGRAGCLAHAPGFGMIALFKCPSNPCFFFFSVLPFATPVKSQRRIAAFIPESKPGCARGLASAVNVENAREIVLIRVCAVDGIDPNHRFVPGRPGKKHFSIIGAMLAPGLGQADIERFGARIEAIPDRLRSRKFMRWRGCLSFFTSSGGCQDTQRKNRPSHECSTNEKENLRLSHAYVFNAAIADAISGTLRSSRDSSGE